MRAVGGNVSWRGVQRHATRHALKRPVSADCVVKITSEFKIVSKVSGSFICVIADVGSSVEVRTVIVLNGTIY